MQKFLAQLNFFKWFISNVTLKTKANKNPIMVFCSYGDSSKILIWRNGDLRIKRLEGFGQELEFDRIDD